MCLRPLSLRNQLNHCHIDVSHSLVLCHYLCISHSQAAHWSEYWACNVWNRTHCDVKAEEARPCGEGTTTEKLVMKIELSLWSINICVAVISPHLALTHLALSFLPTSPHCFCDCLSPSFSLISSLSLLDECVLLERADSSYLAEALWTIKIWFQSPAGCWAWGLGLQL